MKAIDVSNVEIDGGLISGTVTDDGKISVFKGIPYAAPPVGQLRWKSPAPVQAWEGVRECNAFSASAVQTAPEPFYMWSEEFLIPKAPIDEDCLYLNVWTGATYQDEKRPVVVWIHGGGFQSGSGSVPIYDGEAMARKGIVYVSVNYRLGVFGFFAHPELTAESPHNASGNYGLMDQLAALQWVKKNIESFGGDPENITIAGQSAGSLSVVSLAASPLSEGLFQKVIAQSGAGMWGMSPSTMTNFPMPLAEAEELGVNIARQTGAKTIGELRDMPADELFGKTSFFWQPIVDGYVLPEKVSAIFQENKANKVSWLSGWNQDEGIMMGGLQNAEEYRAGILAQWGDAAEDILRHYPATNDSVAAVSQKEFMRDLMFGAQNFALANLVRRNGQEVYVYRFTRDVPHGEYEDYGAFHTGEVPYAYNNLTFVDRPFTETDRRLADIMSSMWSNFAARGNPNGQDLPEWPAYDRSSRQIMMLGDQPHSSMMPDSSRLLFLQALLMNEL